MGLVALALFCSCGKFSRLENGGYTKVEFQKNQDPKAAVLNGGIMIYAYSPSFTTSTKVNDETGSASMTLPNGAYSFYAIGYGVVLGSTYTEDTDIHCAVVGDTALTGTARTISLNLTKAQCSNDAFIAGGGAFSDTGTVNAIPKMDFVHCSSSAGTVFNSTAWDSNKNCGTSISGNVYAPWTAVSKYKLKLPLVVFSGGSAAKTGEGLVSACTSTYPSSNGYNSSSEYKRIPLGSTNLPGLFPVEIETYSDASCTSTPIAVHKFYKGIVNGTFPAGPDSKLTASTSGPTARLFLKEP